MKFSGKNLLRLVLSLIMIAGGSYVLWYLFTPAYIIYPEVTELHFESEGGSCVLPIYTDADYNSWHVTSDSWWLKVSKNSTSVSITCSPNDSESSGNRTGSIYMYCDGKNKNKQVRIEITQDENENYIFGEIKDVKVSHNRKQHTDYYEYRNGMLIKIKHDFRHCKSHLKFCAWFYHSDGLKLSSYHSQYCTSDNQVTVQEYVYPSGDEETVELFIPYSEFPDESGLYFKIGILEYDSDEDGNRMSHSYYGPKFEVHNGRGKALTED